jgi:hypothetical protein
MQADCRLLTQGPGILWECVLLFHSTHTGYAKAGAIDGREQSLVGSCVARAWLCDHSPTVKWALPLTGRSDGEQGAKHLQHGVRAGEAIDGLAHLCPAHRVNRAAGCCTNLRIVRLAAAPMTWLFPLRTLFSLVFLGIATVV